MADTTVLERTPTATTEVAPHPTQCCEPTDCVACNQVLDCEHTGAVDHCRDGDMHPDCHRASCRDPECWGDPDSQWYDRHEW